MMDSLSPWRLPGALWEQARTWKAVLTPRSARCLRSSGDHVVPKMPAPHQPLQPKARTCVKSDVCAQRGNSALTRGAQDVWRAGPAMPWRESKSDKGAAPRK